MKTQNLDENQEAKYQAILDNYPNLLMQNYIEKKQLLNYLCFCFLYSYSIAHVVHCLTASDFRTGQFLMFL